MTYSQILAHLDALQMHKIKLGLDAMQDFLAKVGRPEQKMQFVHLAGTNGKGSVCAALAEVLGMAGYRVGVYTSPHLSSVRERFRVGSEYINEEAFSRIGSRICEILGDEQITYFEFTTALGLLWFEESGVDLVLLETGMGGRLDATNVVTPLLSVITSISMDHEIYLGNTLAEIAFEKAGIIKAGVPVVSGATHPEAADVIAEVAGKKEAPLYCLGRDFDYRPADQGQWHWFGETSLGGVRFDDLIVTTPSPVQYENHSLAVAVLLLLKKQGFNVDEGHIRDGLREVKWPGRMEYFPLDTEAGRQRFLLDGAHNPAGVKNLAVTLTESFDYEKLIVIWGAMADKDISATLGLISPLTDTLLLTRPEGERSAYPVDIFNLLSAEDQQRAQCIDEPEKALQCARELAGEEDLVVIGGSLYLLGAMRALLLGDLV